MNASDSDDDLYNERTALVPAENPAVPSYRPDSDFSPPEDTPTKRVKVRFLFSEVCPAALALSIALCWCRRRREGDRVKMSQTEAARIRKWTQRRRS